MSQSWDGAHIGKLSGAGGSAGPNGKAGRGGDIGSRNRWDSSTRNSHNDSSVHRNVTGSNYEAPVDQGDKFNGPISHSAVGGRGNTNTLSNYGGSGGDTPSPSSREADIDQRMAQIRQRLAAKKERERLKQKEEELKRLEAELGDDD
ncbi:hypothetical protein CVT26_002442 [Gymnopilus dilepis]|uniref:Uncharacterized protein n=1 Tax=Gymnopilus dilepis TaxID=231916 RepID=A0A409Y3M2_9AGAR|nr:hypothetical protein CVT26_002442 [Gymnopilus dilepis]